MNAVQDYKFNAKYGLPSFSVGMGGGLTVARAFPTAGDAGRRLRLLEEVLHEPERAEERAVVGEAVEPGLALSWLADVYSSVARNDPDGAIDVLFARMDELLAAGEFQRCDAVLKTIDPKRLDTNLLVAALSATKRAAGRLPARGAFIRRVRTRLEQLAPDRVDRLLAGLV